VAVNSSVVFGMVTLGCIGIFITATVVMIVIGHQREKARQRALEAWAATNRWQLVRHPQVDWGQRMPGRAKRGVTLALYGNVRGRPVCIAEYRYTTSSYNGTSTQTNTHHFTLCVVRLRRPFPPMGVARRGGMSRFGRSLFGDGRTALRNEAFDRQFKVSAADPRLIPEVLGPRLVGEHIAGLLPNWTVSGNELISYRTGLIGQPESILVQFAGVLRIADLLEAHA
jgi:hypothetical protein